MPAPQIVSLSDGAPELAADLEAERVCSKYLNAGSTVYFRCRKRSRHHCRAGVTAQRGKTVIEVECVRTHAVRECSFGGRCADVVAPKACPGFCAELAHPAQCDLS